MYNASQFTVSAALTVDVNAVKINAKGRKKEMKRFLSKEIIEPPNGLLIMMIYEWGRKKVVVPQPLITPINILHYFKRNNYKISNKTNFN